ncbi:hypothetical protein M0811_00305 [Anaeramoeba ignava]|uniref:Uncharacterized protein n=1 Tax=Anaeramoeba ignava TaxID=1746090 RepID=A0A9Q0LTH3_ANAIG|nr:hypothetical protein M0811_00305 [Anaeramoeba ignava]
MNFFGFLLIFLFLTTFSYQCPNTFAHLGEYCNNSQDISCYDFWSVPTMFVLIKMMELLVKVMIIAHHKFVITVQIPGDSCQINQQCYTTNNCTNGVCQGISIGEPCTNGSTSTCQKGAFCGDFGSGFVCTESINPGASCLAASQVTSSGEEMMNLCKDFRLCMPDETQTGAICGDLFSRDVGGYCSQSFGCKLGLYCQNPSPIGTCQNFAENTVTCSKNDDCPFGTACDCNSATCTQTGNFNSMNEIQNGLSCFGQYHCVFNNPYHLGSCAMSNCLDELKALECAMSTDHKDTFYPPYYWDCKGNGAQSTMILSFGLLIGSLLFFF